MLELARFFEPIKLNNEEWTDVTYFAIGPVDEDRLAKVIEWAQEEAKEDAEDYEEDAFRYVPQKPEVRTGMFKNDRYLASAENYAWAVGLDRDLDNEWQSDEENYLELCKVAEKDEDGCAYCGESGPCQTTFDDGRCRDPDEMLDNWQDIVNANPDRYPLAPLGPFEGVMVTVRLRCEKKQTADV